MTSDAPSTHDDMETIAALDLGSNSFHMIVGRIDQGQLIIVDKLREMVRLGAGLNKDKSLDPEVEQRALDCLSRFGQRIRGIAPHDVRAVGTNTMRQVKDGGDFLRKAEKALGHPIEIISGREEARLIYLGIAHGLAGDDQKRLVVDIGGGSTELIIGEGLKSDARESLYMGCVNTGQRHYPDGKITKDAMANAILKCRVEVRPVRHTFHSRHWENAVGSSGTIKAIQKVLNENGWSENEITAAGLKKIRKALVEFGHIDDIDLPGLSEERKPVFVGGVTVLSAVFKALDIKTMQVSNLALREGALYELAGITQDDDVRDRTINAFTTRYSVDKEQADHVQDTALWLFDQVEDDWLLLDPLYRKMLGWAAQLHEIGLGISHNGFHKHSAYILEHADMPGFAKRHQNILAAMVRIHRRKISKHIINELPKEARTCVPQLAVLLRLAVLMHRGRSHDKKPRISLRVNANDLHVSFPKGWLEDHPLTETELNAEAEYLEAAGFKLTYS